jgi:SAM-dependent methyltransferase
MILPLVQKQDGELIAFKDFPQEIHPERLWVLRHLMDPIGVTIVDVGCGSHKTISEAFGVDVMPVTDLQASLDDLPFENDSVDVIISRHSLEHVLDPIKALREWYRVLRKDGRVVIVLPDEAAVPTMQPALSGGMHLHAYDMASFRNLVELTNLFDVEKIEVVLEDWSFGAILRPYMHFAQTEETP